MSLTNFEDLDQLLDSLHPDHQLIFNLIEYYDQNNPIKSAQIESAYSIGGPAVRKIIRYYRLIGKPVGSSSKGYYIAHSKEEYSLTLAHLKERALKELEIVSVGEKINWDKPHGEQVTMSF